MPRGSGNESLDARYDPSRFITEQISSNSAALKIVDNCLRHDSRSHDRPKRYLEIFIFFSVLFFFFLAPDVVVTQTRVLP